MTFTEDEEAMAVVIREKEPIGENFELGCRIALNQPMFTHHDTFIIGFSYAKKHMAAAPAGRGIEQFTNEFAKHGISHGTIMFRLPWDKPVPYDLLQEIIEFNIADKKEVTTFWRK